MRAFLEAIFRLKWWFFGDGDRYDKYYVIASIRRLGLDPRAVRRARERGGLAALLGIAISLIIANAVLEMRLHEPASFGPVIPTILIPGSLVFLTFRFGLITYPNPALDHAIHAAFLAAWETAIVGIALSVWLSGRVYHSSKYDRSGLTTEEGTQRWITPDELKASGLLPANYDPTFGFAWGSRVRQATSRRRIAEAMPSGSYEATTHAHLGWAMLATLPTCALFLPVAHSATETAAVVASMLALGYVSKTYIGYSRHALGAWIGAIVGLIASVFVPHAHVIQYAVGASIGALIALSALTLSLSRMIDELRVGRTQMRVLGLFVLACATAWMTHLTPAMGVLLVVGITVGALRSSLAPIAATAYAVGVPLIAHALSLPTSTSYTLATLVPVAAIASGASGIRLLVASPQKVSP